MLRKNHKKNRIPRVIREKERERGYLFNWIRVGGLSNARLYANGYSLIFAIPRARNWLMLYLSFPYWKIPCMLNRSWMTLRFDSRFYDSWHCYAWIALQYRKLETLSPREFYAMRDRPFCYVTFEKLASIFNLHSSLFYLFLDEGATIT